MKKKIIIILIALLFITTVIFLPIPQGSLNDGGTRVYNALTYKYVVWNKLITDSSGVATFYKKSSVYWLPNSTKSIDELWKIESKDFIDNNENSNEETVDILRQNYPQYFNLDTFKGLEVYVWQMGQNSYRFGLLPGTNRNKTFQELINLDGIRLEDMKIILSTYNISSDDIMIIPYHHPYSSYSVQISETDIQKLYKQLGLRD